MTKTTELQREFDFFAVEGEEDGLVLDFFDDGVFTQGVADADNLIVDEREFLIARLSDARQ